MKNRICMIFIIFLISCKIQIIVSVNILGLTTCFKTNLDKFDCSYAKYFNVLTTGFISKDGLCRNTECFKSNFYCLVFMKMKFL